MLSGQGSRKAIAATLLLVFFTQTFAPTISYALTAGPTQPEATSFEPIDTTDMVNLQTGDFNYNIPLLEVPGPEGGYPLALSYHAGVQPNVDASWVGLGWSLNPGAINRSVNGYPDDWNNPATTTHNYWAGGTTTTYSVGVSIGIANIASVEANLSFAHDTYRGFGVGAGVELNAGLSQSVGEWMGLGLNASIGVGVSPFGGTYANASANLGLTMAPLSYLKSSVKFGFNTNFQSVSSGFSGGATLGGKGTSLGVSITSAGTKASLTIGGLSSSVSNSNSGRVSTSSQGFNLDIPVLPGLSLSLGYSKVRYWTDESTSITTWGSLTNLGSGDANNGDAGYDNMAYDTYSLLELPSYENIVDYGDPTTVQGGSFPDFDVYNIQGQGLGGNMRPFLFQGRTQGQNLYNASTPLVKYYAPGVANANPHFRFENDFSNSYRQSENDYSNLNLNLRLISPPMDPSPVFGNNDGNYGKDVGASDLSGSKEVNIGSLGNPLIYPRHPLGYNKADRFLTNTVEGFSITNESGMTYHYGLPAYTFGEENYQELIDQSHGATGNRVTKPTQYVYNWYLTTITGPDYVDRNNNGIADDGDWGYWVDFEYGKWSNRYNWRNPSEGFNADEDNQWQDVSMGTREVYYLNAVRTRTHVALFEKDIRNDGKGASPQSFIENTVGNIQGASYQNQGLYNINSSQSLKLSHIYLLNASDENFVTPGSGNSAAYQPTTNRLIPCTDCELASNVLDRSDVDAVGRAALEAKAIRVIDFNYDYSLSPGTTNSFDINSPSTLLGKLTLLNFEDRGKGGANLLPPTSFGYELSAQNMITQTGVSLTSTSFTTTNTNFNVGDLIAFNNPAPTFAGVITAKTPSGSNTIYTLANGRYTGGTISANVYTTKNPPYNKDAFDSWGMYKSDYNLTAIAGNSNLGRMTTPCSSAAIDAWSLRTINPPLGNQVNIGYESDQIGTAALSVPYPYIITSPTQVGGSFTQINFGINTFGYPLTSVVAPGDIGQFICQDYYTFLGAGICVPFSSTYVVNSVDYVGGTATVTLSTPIPSSNGSFSFSQILTGNISGNLTQVYGGGIRVNNISMTNSDGVVTTTSYNYNTPGTNTCSGVTSYMPSILDRYDITAIENKPGSSSFEKYYKKLLYSTVNGLYTLARELPPPGVMYQYVTVANKIKNPDELSTRAIEGSTQYQFETFNPNMVGIVDATARQAPNSTSLGIMSSHNLELDKFITSIGNVKRIVQFDATGRKLSETINHYLHDNLANFPLASFMSQYKSILAQYNYQGYLMERYNEVKDVTNQAISTNNGVKATLSTRIEFPCIQTGQTIVNYVNGTQTSSVNQAFDFYSGAVTQTLETDAYGNNTMTQTIPAYRKYPAMGLKMHNNNNKNMLTQTAESYSWKLASDAITKVGLISATATTWSDNFSVLDVDGTAYTQNLSYDDVWRQQSTYKWMSNAQSSDGTTPVASFNDFNWTTPTSSDPTWKNDNTITIYDVYSKAMEATDINNLYGATHLDYGDKKVILTGGPANFYEMAYSGAEDLNLTQVSNIFVHKGGGVVSTAAGTTHTGAQSLQLGVSGVKGFTYTVPTANLVAGRTYQASVWVKPATGTTSTVGLYYDIDGTIKSSASSASSTKTANGWTLVNLVINGSDIVSGHTLDVWCRNDNTSIQAYVDDFRFQPLNATTTAYVYDPFSGELTYLLDNSNIYTNYVYDGVGRLTSVNKEKLQTGVFQTNQYQYNFGMAQYQSAALNTTLNKNNCPANQSPNNPSTVNVPAGYYNSFISQADADAHALLFAQDYANLHGTCGCSPTFIYSAGISSLVGQISVSGTTANFTDVFTWPTGAEFVNVGNINGNCAFPSATRNVPLTIGSSGYIVTVSTTGNVQIQCISGPLPSGILSFNGSYPL